ALVNRLRARYGNLPHTAVALPFYTERRRERYRVEIERDGRRRARCGERRLALREAGMQRACDRRCIAARHHVHVHHARALANEMVVHRRLVDATLLETRHHDRHFILGEDEVAHRERLAVAGTLECKPATERETRLEPRSAE